MRRVIVLGCAGSGKSTFARRLGARIGVPVVHMDALYWDPGWTACEDQEFRRRAIEAHRGDAWVSDGNYSTKTFDIRVPRADAIVWLRQPRHICVRRAMLRYLKNIGRVREDIGPDCPEKIDMEFLLFIWNYERQVYPRHEAHLATFNAEDRVTRLFGDAQARAWLDAVASLEHA